MPLINKALCKKLFKVPHRQALTDAEFNMRAAFLRGTVLGSGHECKDWLQDVAPFLALFRPDWAKLYARYSGRKATGVVEWPVFEEPDKLLFVVHGRNAQGWMVETHVEVASISEWQT